MAVPYQKTYLGPITDDQTSGLHKEASRLRGSIILKEREEMRGNIQWGVAIAKFVCITVKRIAL